MAHDVFICYASEDKVTANAACALLEAAGIRCWIAPRDPIAGIPYGRQLIDAITNTRIVLLIFSGNANHSEHVLRELEVASDANKVVVPFRIEEVAPSGDLRYYITRVHWLDALTPPLEHRLDELLTLIQRLLEMPTTELLEMPGRKAPPPPAGRAAKHRSASSPLMMVAVGALSAAVLGLIVVLVFALRSQGTASRVAALPAHYKVSNAHRAHRAPPKVALRSTTAPTPAPTVPPRTATPAPTPNPDDIEAFLQIPQKTSYQIGEAVCPVGPGEPSCSPEPIMTRIFYAPLSFRGCVLYWGGQESDDLTEWDRFRSEHYIADIWVVTGNAEVEHGYFSQSDALLAVDILNKIMRSCHGES